MGQQREREREREREAKPKGDCCMGACEMAGHVWISACALAFLFVPGEGKRE